MRRVLHVSVALLLAAVTMSEPSAQSAPDPIRYTLRFPSPQTHYMEVEAVVPTGRRPQIELMMAVWTPGSYLVREYQRHLEGLTATGDGGRALTAVKPAKNRWRIDTGGAATVTVRYRVYGREMTVRNNWIEAGFAMLNGAPTFLTLADKAARPHEVTIDPPAAWKTSATPLMPVAGRAHSYRAEDFDTLVDSPIIIGNPVVKTFDVDGKRHHLVLEGDPSLFDADRAAADVQKIVLAGRAAMGKLDYPHYFFLNMVTESGGGLEHKNAFLTMSSRFTTRTRRAYVNWLNLVGHEYFHNWNVKRLRPVELGPFDYETENYTKSLWVAEGFTDYYGALLVRRAGLQTPAEYFDELSNAIEQVQMRPGRTVQPVDMASFDTWIKQYRPDENSNNTNISYYTKGAVIAAVLDARIRFATNGQKSLDDVMRLAYQRYSGPKGFTEAEFRAVVVEVGGESLRDVLARALDTTQPLEYQPLLDAYGLQFVPADSTATKGWLGIRTRIDAGRLVINEVQRGTPAAEAGLNVDDEIIAIGDYRVRPEQWEARLVQYPPTTKASLLVARRDELVRVEVTFGQEPGNAWRLQPRPNATAAQLATRAAWLNTR